MLLAFLRHPEVTVVQYHGLMFDGGIWALYRKDRECGEYVEIGPAPVLPWFYEAAVGASYATVAVDWAKTMAVQSRLCGEESYDEIAAGLFVPGDQRTLIVHNAGDAQTVELRVAPDAHAESLATPDVSALYHRAPPEIRDTQIHDGHLELPARSVTRVTWT
jgi:hypothetical protein